MEWAQRYQGLLIFVLIILFSLGFRFLGEIRIQQSALLYIGFPALVTTALLAFTRRSDGEHWALRYWNHSRAALIVLLGSSVVLLEGFLCVLMFMPIYFAVVFAVFAIEALYRYAFDKGQGSRGVHVLPLLLLLASTEGVVPELSFERENSVSVSRYLDSTPAQIHRNLAMPIELDPARPLFLRLFPIPWKIDNPELREGSIHRSHFRYHRWFYTNTHEGEMAFRLSEVSPQRVELELLEDDSYIATYLRLHGTRLDILAAEDGGSHVTLTMRYRRLLDPAWYFDPMQAYAMELAAAYIIDNIVERRSTMNH